jgi:hypothetical protein
MNFPEWAVNFKLIVELKRHCTCSSRIGWSGERTMEVRNSLCTAAVVKQRAANTAIHQMVVRAILIIV